MVHDFYIIHENYILLIQLIKITCFCVCCTCFIFCVFRYTGMPTFIFSLSIVRSIFFYSKHCGHERRHVGDGEWASFKVAWERWRTSRREGRRQPPRSSSSSKTLATQRHGQTHRWRGIKGKIVNSLYTFFLKKNTHSPNASAHNKPMLTHIYEHTYTPYPINTSERLLWDILRLTKSPRVSRCWRVCCLALKE